MATQKERLVRIHIHCFDNGVLVESMTVLPNGEIGSRAETQKVHENLEAALADVKERMDDNEEIKRAARMAGVGFEIPGEQKK